MSGWIDCEQELPPEGERVIVLMPFGMLVSDDTWMDGRWLNTDMYVSHWRPINPPGTYSEIMQRPRGNLLPVSETPEHKENSDLLFSAAIVEHYRMMDALIMTQMKLRLEAKQKTRDE